MQPRDLFFGLLLLSGAAWIAVASGSGATSPTFLLAVVGCGLAGVVYLATDMLRGRTVGGRRLTRVRIRAMSQACLGVSIGALGVDGFLTGGDLVSGAIAIVGILVIAFAAFLWTRGPSDAPPRD